MIAKMPALDRSFLDRQCLARVPHEILRSPGAILLVSTYELGHQPLALASALGFLGRAGFDGDALDVSVERFDEAKVARACFVGIPVPMHTALRLAVPLVARIRRDVPASILRERQRFGPGPKARATSRGRRCAASTTRARFESLKG